MDFSAKIHIFWISCVFTNLCQTVQHTGVRGAFHDTFHTYSVVSLYDQSKKTFLSIEKILF